MGEDLNRHARALVEELSSQGVTVMSKADALDFVRLRYGNNPNLVNSLTFIADQVAASLVRGTATASSRGSPGDPNSIMGDFTRKT